MINNLFQVIYRPRYFYSFVENKWIQNINQLNENDVVTKINDLTDELLNNFYSPVSATVIYDYIKMRSALSPNGKLRPYQPTPLKLAAIYMTIDKFWYDYNAANQEKRIKLIKENLQVYLINNQKTIIYKEFLKEVNNNHEG